MKKFTVKEKLEFYGGRVNDPALSARQRKFARERLEALNGRKSDKHKRPVEYEKLLVEKYSEHAALEHDDEFSRGYCTGVIAYQMYDLYDAVGKKAVKDFLSVNRELAVYDDQPMSKGVMAGAGDAAKERKRYRK